MKIEQLNTLATELVGDGKSPNLFFVTKDGNTIVVTVQFDAAYELFQSLYRAGKASAIEDRLTGTIASYDVEEDSGTKKVLWDDSRRFGFRS